MNSHVLYTLLKEVFLMVDDGDRRFFNQFDISSARYYTLYHIGEEPGISFSELSNLMICDKSNISRIIKGLESEGLVIRRPHETDGRMLRLFLSEEGEALRDKAMSAHQHFNQERFNDLDDTKKNDLIAGLQQLKNNLYPQLEADL